MNRTSLLPIIQLTPRVRARLAFKRHIAIMDGRNMAVMQANPASPEFIRFMRSVHTTDQSACWLALHKAKTQHLTIAAAVHFAQKELNDFTRAHSERGVKMPETDRMSSTITRDDDMQPVEKPAMLVDENKLAACFQEKKPEREEKQDTKRWSMALIHNDEKYFALAPDFLSEHYAELAEHEQQISDLLDLQHAVKPRDRLILTLRFELGLSISEIAAKMGKTNGAIYAAFDRITPLLCAAKERKSWADTHCSLQNLIDTDDGIPVVPVVLDVFGADGQMGWDLEVQP